jgi:hypothetical protein
MNIEEVRVELFWARCKRCGREFEIVSPVREDLMPGRTTRCEVAMVNSFSNEVFDEVGHMSDQILAEWLELKGGVTASCFHRVFGYACDLSPLGLRYDFSGAKRCPSCGCSEVSFGPHQPGLFECRLLPYVTHQQWARLRSDAKRSLLTRALKEVGCLPTPEARDAAEGG